MAILPNSDQPLLAAYVFGKSIAQESEILDVRRENNDVRHQATMANIEVSKWKRYALQLEETINELNADGAGVAATRDALVAEGQACDHPEHHKLSHSKDLRNQMYDKGYAAAEPIIKK